MLRLWPSIQPVLPKSRPFPKLSHTTNRSPMGSGPPSPRSTCHSLPYNKRGCQTRSALQTSSMTPLPARCGCCCARAQSVDAPAAGGFVEEKEKTSSGRARVLKVGAGYTRGRARAASRSYVTAAAFAHRMINTRNPRPHPRAMTAYAFAPALPPISPSHPSRPAKWQARHSDNRISDPVPARLPRPGPERERERARSPHSLERRADVGSTSEISKSPTSSLAPSFLPLPQAPGPGDLPRR